MLIMAIEAAKQMAADVPSCSGIQIEDALFEAPISVPESGQIEVQISMRPVRTKNQQCESWEFRIFTFLDRADTSIENSRGVVSILYHKNQRVGLELDAEDMGDYYTQETSISSRYEAFKEIGYTYGPVFQRINHLKIQRAKACGSINLTVAHGPKGYSIHPAALDACLHPLLALLFGDRSKSIQTAVPSRVQRLWISADLINQTAQDEDQHILDFVACLSSKADKLKGSVVASHRNSSLIYIENVELTPIAMHPGKNATSAHIVPKCFQIEWLPDINSLEANQLKALCQMGSGSGEEPIIICKTMDLLLRSFIQAVGVTVRDIDPKSLKEPLATYLAWFQQELDSLERVDSEPSALSDICEEASMLSNLGKLIVRVGRNLEEILLKGMDPLSLLFQDDLMAEYYNETAANTRHVGSACKYISHLASCYPEMKFLEIGGGTGATTNQILEALHENDIKKSMYASYEFTDVSTVFFEKARQRFAAYEKFSTKQLDIEKSPEDQGFHKHTYDVVVAANVRPKYHAFGNSS